MSLKEQGQSKASGLLSQNPAVSQPCAAHPTSVPSLHRWTSSLEKSVNLEPWPSESHSALLQGLWSVTVDLGMPYLNVKKADHHWVASQ